MIKFWVLLVFVLVAAYLNWAARPRQPRPVVTPDCVACNGWPVIMVSYTWGYHGDWYPYETLCAIHRIQGRRIAILEAQVLDKDPTI